MKTKTYSLTSYLISSLTLFISVSVFGQSLTPIAYQGYNSDGSAQTNPLVFQAFPPVNSVVVVGTNVYSGGYNPTFTPNSSGFFSNSITPNAYRVTIPAQSLVFFVNIPATSSYQSLSLYITNQPVIPGNISSYAIITNQLGFAPATNNYPLQTTSNPTNSFTVSTVYANGAFKSDIVGWASGGILYYTNNSQTGYLLPVTNDFTVPLGTNATWSVIGGSISNVVNWIR